MHPLGQFGNRNLFPTTSISLDCPESMLKSLLQLSAGNFTPSWRIATTKVTAFTSVTPSWICGTTLVETRSNHGRLWSNQSMQRWNSLRWTLRYRLDTSSASPFVQQERTTSPPVLPRLFLLKRAPRQRCNSTCSIRRIEPISRRPFAHMNAVFKPIEDSIWERLVSTWRRSILTRPSRWKRE